jgi:lipopolysaccharide biosynthesis glycosyltransferase
VPHLAVMLLSLVENNPRYALHIFVLSDIGLAEKTQLRETLKRNSDDISFLDVPDGQLGHLMTSVHVSNATYARLLMGELLPRDIDRVLYLDSDIVVRGDIEELWNTDLGGKTVGAVLDIPRFTFQNKLGMPPDAPYFNGGVLLIDLYRWRDLNIGKRALNFATEHPNRLTWWDQCALNLFLLGDWLALDSVWNFQTLLVAQNCHGLLRFARVDRRALDRARIIHFSGPSKPWHYLNDHPLKSEYLKYRNLTAWPLVRFDDYYPHNILRKFLLRHAPILLPLYVNLRRYI